MVINIVTGTGSGPTKMAAFDAALIKAGIANYNLIRLSSIVPPSSKIVVHKGPLKEQPGQWGDRLYVVMAEMRVTSPNAEAWAGIGWVRDKKTGKGLFVEHEGTNDETIKRDIRQSLTTMMKNRGADFSPIHMTVLGKTCKSEPVCALVIAVFKAENWEPNVKFDDA